MKTLKLMTICICFVTGAFSQNLQCDSLEKANSKLTERIDGLLKENEYFRKTLNILTPVASVEQGGLTFNLTKCEGNLEAQTITLTFFIINHRANSDFQFEKSNFVDIQGKNFESYGIQIGGRIRHKLFTDTPVEAKVTFKQVLPATKMIQVAHLSYFGTGLFEQGSFGFKDIAVTWK